MRGNSPRFSYFFIVVMVVMALGLLFIGDDDENSEAPPASDRPGQAEPGTAEPLQDTGGTATRPPTMDSIVPGRGVADETVGGYVREELLPALYRSNDVQGLIAGATLLTGRDSDLYTIDDMLVAGLSLVPDDPLLLAVVALSCTPHRDWRPEGDFGVWCDEVDYFDRLESAAGDNAWVWAMRARAALPDEERMLEYLDRVAGATYHNDYAVELRIAVLSSLQKYGRDAPPIVMLDALGRTTWLNERSVAGRRICDFGRFDGTVIDDRLERGCRRLAVDLDDAATLLGQITAARIRQNLALMDGESMLPIRLQWANRQELDAFYERVNVDAAARDRYMRHLFSYTEADAARLTMIELGLIADDGFEPQPISVHIIE